MRLLNIVVFAGLVLAGGALLLGISSSPSSKWTSLFLTFGVVAGWLFAVIAVLLFVGGTIAFLVRRTEEYWNTLYPINFGLVVFGISALAFRTDVTVSWLTYLTVGVVAAITLYLSPFMKWRWLPFLVVGPLLLPVFIETHISYIPIQIAISALLISLPVVSFLIDSKKKTAS